MGYTLTQEQADELTRLLDMDRLVDDYDFIDSLAGPFHHYFLDDGTILEIGQDGQIQHQELIEDPTEGLVPRDTGLFKAQQIESGDVEYIRSGKVVGYFELPRAAAGRVIQYLEPR